MDLRKIFAAFIMALSLQACASVTASESAVLRDFPRAPISPNIKTNAISNIAFGSCAPNYTDTIVYDSILKSAPDLFLMLGDNVYGSHTPDDPQLSGLRSSYWQLSKNAGFRALVAQIPTNAVWDDHDFGQNDGDADFAYKELSEKMFETFWNVANNDERKRHKGIYSAFSHGAPEQKVQIIMLDTRFFRDSPLPTDAPMQKGKERYMPYPKGANSQVLGDAQWQWLEAKLKEPAKIRIILSSIQLVADGHGWEAWTQFPDQRQKFYDLIDKTNAKGVIVLSGDRHHASINVYRNIDYPIYDFTSSPLSGEANNAASEIAPNRIYYSPSGQTNFGQLKIDWTGRRLNLNLLSDKGALLHSHEIGFGEIGL